MICWWDEYKCPYSYLLGDGLLIGFLGGMGSSGRRDAIVVGFWGVLAAGWDWDVSWAAA